MSGLFRVAFIVTYNKKSLFSEEIFTIKSIDLADPCINDNAEDQMCHGNGICEPLEPVRGHICHCNEGFMNDTDCYRKDYCSYKIEGVLS